MRVNNDTSKEHSQVTFLVLTYTNSVFISLMINPPLVWVDKEKGLSSRHHWSSYNSHSSHAAGA